MRASDQFFCPLDMKLCPAPWRQHGSSSARESDCWHFATEDLARLRAGVLLYPAHIGFLGQQRRRCVIDDDSEPV